MATYLDDRKLVKRLCRGDSAAFDRFFEENYARLYRFALSRLNGNRDAAEDIAQTTLTRAARNLSSYKAEAALFTWLCAICRNEMSDWLTKNQRHAEHVVLTEDFPAVQAIVDSLTAPLADTPDAHYRRSESIRLISVAMDSLPAKYGNVLEWKYIEGHSVIEIADRLGIGREAAQSLIARAKRAFAEVYRTMSDAIGVAEHEAQQT